MKKAKVRKKLIPVILEEGSGQFRCHSSSSKSSGFDVGAVVPTTESSGEAIGVSFSPPSTSRRDDRETRVSV